MTIAERYPKGLNRTIALFQKALRFVVSTDEINKVLNYAGWNERKAIREVKEKFLEYDAKDVPIWMLITQIKDCPSLLADVFAVMVSMDKETIPPEELEEFFKVKDGEAE